MKDCTTVYQENNLCDSNCHRAFQAEKRQKEQAKPRTARVSAKPKKKAKSLAKLANEAAELLQRLVRLKAADANGYCACVTCGKVDHFSKLQGGHFIERGRLSVKLLEEQINPQCPYCNHYGMKLASVVLAYRRYLVDMYGEKWVKWLEAEALKVKKYTRQELEDMKADFRARIAEQEKRLRGS